MATVKELSDKGPDGTRLGQSAADLVSFHGVTPIAAATLTTLTSGTLGDANTAINLIQTALRNKGLIL